MEKVAQDKAKIFINWYQDILENHRERLFAYLGPTVCLDWFGRSCIGCKKVTKLINGLEPFKHIIENIEPRKQLTHRNNKNLQPKIVLKKDQDDYDESSMHDNTKYIDPDDFKDSYLDKSILSDEYINLQAVPLIMNAQLLEPIQPSDNEFHTPEKTAVVIDVPIENGGGDAGRISMQYVVATGYLETNLDTTASCSTSTADTRSGTNRQFLKLKIAYTEDLLGNEYTIWYIIYESKNKCRRNLLTQFENAYNEDLKSTTNSNISSDEIC